MAIDQQSKQTNTSDELEIEDGSYEHFSIIIDKKQEPIRIDKFLLHRLEKTSRNRIQNAAKSGSIRVNNKTVKSNYKVRPLDKVSLILPNPEYETELKPEPIDLNIVFEDDDILVINKQAGLVVHPGVGNWSGTLINGLLHYLPKDKKPGLAHRIDKNTSGLLVVAKTEYALSHLAKQFFDHTVNRKYIALVWGDIESEKGTITGNIGRDLKQRKQFTVFPDEDYGKHAVTHYKVLKRFGYVTLVECQLETGRTHQIRVHMKYLGHTLFNDEFYGGNKILKGTVYTKYKQFVENCFKILPRQALHAKTIGFIHPTTEKEMLFDSDLPEEFEQVLKKWEVYTSNSMQ